MEQKDAILSVSLEASQEMALEDLLDKMSAKWNTLEFTVLPFKDAKDAFILGSTEEVTATLEDSLVTMSTILASRHKLLLSFAAQAMCARPKSVFWMQRLPFTYINCAFDSMQHHIFARERSCSTGTVLCWSYSSSG